MKTLFFLLALALAFASSAQSAQAEASELTGAYYLDRTENDQIINEAFKLSLNESFFFVRCAALEKRFKIVKRTPGGVFWLNCGASALLYFNSEGALTSAFLSYKRKSYYFGPL